MASSVKDIRPQVGSGLTNQKPHHTPPVPREKAVKVGLRRKYIRRESKDHKQQRSSFAAFRDWLRELHGACELHEIATRAKSKKAIEYPENIYPCPTREFHEMIQNEPIARQMARQCERFRRIIVKIRGRADSSTTAEEVMAAWRELVSATQPISIRSERWGFSRDLGRY